ncbi:helix-turn-helix domain-containing protein [Nocardia jejuensis]|uniref:helix-turn-helix domain-containing protein n=1 Tax=Nocardia jejuensis TaxID=328049 RepID=UPI0014711C75|nr:helix-turn-helix domain-containing protein [Nocardia jejuensis]
MSGNQFGAYLRQRRRDAGLTREQLAHRTNISASLIEKIERGVRPATLPTLSTLMDGLDVPPSHRRHVLSRALPDVFAHPSPPAPPRPTPEDLADLNSLDHPASFYLMPTFEVVAVNPAYERAFPGVAAGTNFLEWMFLNPISRTVMVDWHRDAHRLVDSLRTFAPLTPHDPNVAAVIANCRTAPDWPVLWNKRPHPDTQFDEHLTVRDPATSRVQHLTPRTYTPELPMRPWWLCRLIPTTNELVPGNQR